MNRQKFGQYVFTTATRSGDIRYVVASYNVEYKIYFHDLTSRESVSHGNVTYASRDVGDLPSCSTRRQALRRARYLYGKGGQLSALYSEPTTSRLATGKRGILHTVGEYLH